MPSSAPVVPSPTPTPKSTSTSTGASISQNHYHTHREESQHQHKHQDKDDSRDCNRRSSAPLDDDGKRRQAHSGHDHPGTDQEGRGQGQGQGQEDIEQRQQSRHSDQSEESIQLTRYKYERRLTWLYLPIPEWLSKWLGCGCGCGCANACQTLLTEEERLEAVRNKFKFVTEEDVERYRQMFDALDKDGNEVLDRQELQNAFVLWGEELTDAEFRYIFNKYDEDQSGVIEFPEFIAILAEKKQSILREHHYKSILQQYGNDPNGTGYMPEEDVRQGLKMIDKYKFGNMEDTGTAMHVLMKSIVKKVERNEKGEIRYMELVQNLRWRGLLK